MEEYHVEPNTFDWDTTRQEPTTAKAPETNDSQQANGCLLKLLVIGAVLIAVPVVLLVLAVLVCSALLGSHP